jgi:integral membrane protein (TIGR00529 family)
VTKLRTSEQPVRESAPSGILSRISGRKGWRVLVWIGFSLSVVLLLLVSRRNLALGMAIAAAVLAAFTLTPASFGEALWRTISDPSVLLLALIVSLIPMIGGAMETSGEMERLVSNLRIGVRPFLAFAPALLGMLPMPGGTLLSAPLIERGAGHTAPDVKAAANVWFRHALLLVYPLGPALIASAKVAGLDVYAVIPYLIPALLLAVGTGYVFLLRRASGRVAQTGPFSVVGLVVPLAIILAAPLLDLLLKGTVDLPVAEIGTSIGVLFSLVAAMAVGRLGPGQLGAIFRRMAPWKYALIVLAMFVFLSVFTVSGVPERIAAMTLPPVVLCVVIGAVLGLITGRIQAPMSIILPIYASTYGAMSAPIFALTYFAVFLGYVLTPIHPCISVSVEYFKTSMGPFLRRLIAPAAIGLVVSLVAGLLLFRL